MAYSFKQAGWVSLGLHGALFFVLALTMLWHTEVPVEPTPFVFSMVQAEVLTAGEVSGEPPPKADYELALPAIEHATLPALPDIPEAVEEDLPLEPVVAPAPKPVPVVPSPAPEKAKPKPDTPKKVSYADFVKEKGPVKEPKPAAKKSTKSTAKVDTQAVKKELAQALKPAGSKNGVAGGSGKKPLSSGPLVDASALAAFNTALRNKIDAVWLKPHAEITEGLVTIVEFYVAPNGALSGVRIVKGSGNPLADRSVLEAFARLGNAGPPPHSGGGTYRLSFSLTA